MPRSRRVPSYRYHKASDQAVVVIDGKSHYLGEWNSSDSRAKYDRLIAEWLVNGRSQTPQPEPALVVSPTVGEVILAFWKHAQSHYRHGDGTPSEELGNLKAALRPVRLLYGMTPARDFGPLALRAVRQRMIEDGLARTSINARVNRVRRAFKWVASVELISVTVVSALATVAGLQKGRSEARESDPIDAVPIDRVEATLRFLPRPVAGLVRLQLLTGMRPGEACAVRGCDLTTGEPNWTYRPGSHKTEHRGKRRVIPLGPKAVALVKEFLTTDLDAYLFSPAESVAEHHARRSAARKSKPTPSEKAQRATKPGSKHAIRYRRNSYLNAINRACDHAFPHPTLSGVRTERLTVAQRAELVAWRTSNHWHPNQLRHTAATDIRARYGLEAAQTVLGHAKADTTEIYAERDLAKAHEVMREIG